MSEFVGSSWVTAYYTSKVLNRGQFDDYIPLRHHDVGLEIVEELHLALVVHLNIL
jgi:hypothetical protein